MANMNQKALEDTKVPIVDDTQDSEDQYQDEIAEDVVTVDLEVDMSASMKSQKALKNLMLEKF